MNECVDSLGDDQAFLILNTNNSDGQIYVKDCDIARTALTSNHTLCQFNGMHLVPRNAFVTFQHFTDIRQCSFMLQLALIHIKNTVNFSQETYQHVDHTRISLSLLNEADMTLKLNTCTLFTIRIGYVRHVIHSGQPWVARHWRDAKRKFRIPMTERELHWFIGFSNFFSKFIRNFLATYYRSSKTVPEAGESIQKM